MGKTTLQLEPHRNWVRISSNWNHTVIGEFTTFDLESSGCHKITVERENADTNRHIEKRLDFILVQYLEQGLVRSAGCLVEESRNGRIERRTTRSWRVSVTYLTRSLFVWTSGCVVRPKSSGDRGNLSVIWTVVGMEAALCLRRRCIGLRLLIVIINIRRFSIMCGSLICGGATGGVLEYNETEAEGAVYIRE
ncbi:hypothetical protein Tco_1516857 [Tanacetum coccineum]